MACRTVVVLSCLGLTAAIPKGSCTDASPESTTCCDVTDASNANCVKHVNWAMETGQPKHPHWYSVYGVSKGDASDTFANFQCALYLIGYNKAEQAKEAGFPSEHHGCPIPCSATVENNCAKPPAVSFKKAQIPQVCPAGSAAVTAPALEPPCLCEVNPEAVPGTCLDTDGTVLEGGCIKGNCLKNVCNVCPTPSSVKPWQIALIVILLLALVAGLAYLLCMPKEKAPKKKKRAIAPVPVARELPAPIAPVVPAPAPMSFTMVPMPQPQPQPVQMVTMVAQPQPQPVQMVQMVAQPQPQPMQSMTMVAQPPPVQMVAQPREVQMMQPLQTTYAAPVQQPVQTTAIPMASMSMVQYAAPQQPVNMFNALDRNGDGVITRAEMAQMGQIRR